MATVTTVSLLKKQKVEKKLPTKVKTRKAKFIIARMSMRIFPGGGREGGGCTTWIFLDDMLKLWRDKTSSSQRFSCFRVERQQVWFWFWSFLSTRQILLEFFLGKIRKVIFPSKYCAPDLVLLWRWTTLIQGGHLSSYTTNLLFSSSMVVA